MHSVGPLSKQSLSNSIAIETKKTNLKYEVHFTIMYN